MSRYRFHKYILRLMSCLLIFLLVFAWSPVVCAETEGTCGENLTWTLENGVLTISGSGPMTEYHEWFLPPWLEMADQIQRVNVDDGVTTISPMAFYHCTNLTAAVLPTSITRLGELAFAGCTSLVLITMDGVQEIGNSCFYNCKSLVNVILPKGLKSIGDKVFYFCSNLGGITVPASVEYFGHSIFAYCNSLVYAKILAPITVLPNWTFYSCDLLWELYLPDAIELVDTSALSECDNLYFVDYGGSDEVREMIQEQLQEKTPDLNATVKNEVTYLETENAIITTTTTIQVNDSEWEDVENETIVHATITGENGWQNVIDAVNDSVNRGYPPAVEVEVLENVTMNGSMLSELTNTSATVTVHTQDNVDWEVIMKDQTSETLDSSQNFTVSIAKNSPGAYPDILGDAVSYTVTLSDTTLNTTVKFPLGIENARQVATLYAIRNRTLEKLCSVIVDDEGMAAFCLAGTAAGEYILALNVPDIKMEDVIIPQALAPHYNIDYSQSTLTDSQGNQYIITGTRNDIGFGLGTLTLIVVGVLVGSTVIVGAVMITINKSRRKAEVYARKPR